MRKFELWLDESGDFYNDSNILKNPSLVGGVLIEKGTLSNGHIKKTLKTDYVHSNEIKREKFGDYALDVLSDIIKHNGNLVIFENKERLEIIDGTTTYLNIISEGLIQLFQFLSAKYGYIEIEVLIAVRLHTEKPNYIPGMIIDNEEYIKRLKEKIIIGLARRTLSNNKYWTWDISLGSARRDPRLMLSDVVCNSYLTRYSRKFNSNQLEELMELYKEMYFFTVFQKSTVGYIKRLLSEGSIGEAIFEIYTLEDSIEETELIGIALDRLVILNDDGIRAQLTDIKNRIGTLVKIDKDFDKSKKVLLKIQDELIPKTKDKKVDMGVFPLDVYLFLLTVYTHEGNIELAEKQIKLCKAAVNKLANRWESIDYYFMFKIRQAVHEINAFNFNFTIKTMEDIENTLSETFGILPLIEGIGELFNDIKSDLLGKTLGTKLLARTFLIRGNSKHLQLAYDESNRAMKEFMHDSDISRQYQYRSQIECEGQNYLEALKYLCESMNIEYSGESSLVTFLEIIMEKQTAVKIYSLMHYSRIMAESAIGNNLNISNLMFKAWDRVKVSNTEMITTPSNMHPYEIIIWKLATYHSLSGNINASMKYYLNAIKICNYKSEHLTLRAIGLGIMAEKASVLGTAGNKYNKDFDTAVREFINSYHLFISNNLPDSMIEYFSNWKDLINTIQRTADITKKSQLLWDISRQITY